MELSYEGRKVIVTGGTGALGTAVVTRLLASGATCYATDWAPSNPRFPYSDDPRVTLFNNVDMADEATATRVYAEASKDGPLWASIHVAGGFAMAPLLETSLETFTGQFRMNAVTAWLGCREAVRAMGNEGGRIVNVAAKPALHPVAGMTAYSASKAAVANLTQSLALELAGQGILVNAIVPSIIDTPANRKAMPGADHDAWPTTDDLAQTIAFLASPQNTVTHGALVPCYGRS